MISHMTITRFVVCSSILAMTLPAGFAREKDEAFQDVQRSVQERSGKTVRWEEDQAAHEQALQDARHLLRKPLTVDTAVQIALLNNRSLQATFEEIGLSTADLIEAATIPNPRFDLAIRFPDKPPSGTYIDYGAAIDFLSIIMIPLKKRIAKDQLEAAALRVGDATLELISQVTCAARSALAVTTHFPPGLNDALLTLLSCRSGSPTGFPVAASHTCPVWSSLAVTTHFRSQPCDRN